MRVVAADHDHIGEAAERLRAGGLVAFPTETVYGLGGDATNAQAVATIFALKARPSFNPLIVHVADVAEAERHGIFDTRARRLADTLWPGPLSLVVERRRTSAICELACAGGPTVAIRVPSFAVAHELLTATGRPVAAPSANPSGYLSPTSAQHVADGFGDADLLVLDGGPSPVGLESTVIDVSGSGPAVLLRAGGMPLADIAQLIGDVTDATAPDQEKPRSPGLLARHYAPRLPLRLGASQIEKDEALLAFGTPVPAGAKATLNLSPSGDLVEAAANLFAMLHELERTDATRIAVMPVPDEGLGRAINDRLSRGAEGSACASPEPA